jgi:hypothetical protein
MAGQTIKWFVLLGLFALCLSLGDARPCFSRGVEPTPVMVVAVGPGKHVIKAGETINLLALHYGVTAAAILKANPGLDPTRLQLGKVIAIPAGSQAAAPSPETASVKPANGIELRPEKSPQATQPLTQAPPARDLADTPVTAAQESLPAASAPAATAQEPAKAARDEATPPKVEEIWPLNPPASATGINDASKLRPVLASLWLLGILGILALFGALALRGPLANFGSGLAMLLFRFPRTGDTVRVGDSMGRVISRGLFFLVVRTRDSERIIVPNAKVMGQGLTVLPPREAE